MLFVHSISLNFYRRVIDIDHKIVKENRYLNCALRDYYFYVHRPKVSLLVLGRCGWSSGSDVVETYVPFLSLLLANKIHYRTNSVQILKWHERNNNNNNKRKQQFSLSPVAMRASRKLCIGRRMHLWINKENCHQYLFFLFLCWKLWTPVSHKTVYFVKTA